MLVLLWPQGAAGVYTLSAEAGALTLSGQDATLTYTPNAPPVEVGVPGGGSVLARGGRRGRRAGSGQHVTHTSGPSYGTKWVQVEELTEEERAAKDAMLEARLAEEAYQRAREAREAARLEAERREAERIANLRHFKVRATGLELRLTKKRSQSLKVTRTLAAGERFLHIRPTAATFARTYRLDAQGATLGLKFGQAGMKHRDAVQTIAHRQEQTQAQMAAALEELRATQAQLKRLKDDNDAMQLLLLAA